MENKYKNGKIYILVDTAYTKQYIGSTCEKLSRRRSRHISSYKYYQAHPDQEHRFTTSFCMFDEFGIDNVKVELFENYPCNNKEELLKREGFYIRKNDCVNKCIAGRTTKERQQMWQEQNKETMKEKKHEYYLNNKEYFQEQGKSYRETNKEQIKERDHHYQDNRDKILRRIKDYNEANKERITEYHNNYYQNNKEKWKQSNEKQRQQITCECGCSLRKKAKSKHLKSKQHQNYINQMNQQEPPDNS